MTRSPIGARIHTIPRLLLALVVLSTGAIVSGPVHAVTGAEGSIHGVVTPEDPFTQWDQKMSVRINPVSWGVGQIVQQVDSNGRFEFPRVPVGTYTITFVYFGTGPYVGGVWTNPAGATAVTVVDGQVVEANYTARIGAILSGTITSSDGNEVISPSVRIAPSGVSGFVQPTMADSTGAWSVKVAPGTYWILFDSETDLWREEYWNNSATRAAATLVTVNYGDVVANLNAVLHPWATISGAVYQELEGGGTAPKPFALVELFNGPSRVTSVQTDAAGIYKFTQVVPGEYNLRFDAPNYDLSLSFVPEWWDDSVTAPGTSITVNDGDQVTAKNAVLSRGITITGHINYRIASPQPLGEALVSAYRFDETLGYYMLQGSFFSHPDGFYYFTNLRPGNYVLYFEDTSLLRLGGEYWRDARYFSESTDVVVEGGDVIALPDMELGGRFVDFIRKTGVDRFGTAAKLTQFGFPGAPGDLSVPVVYIANAYNYPDALSAGPAAVQLGGALLTTNTDSIPQVMKNELVRLNPQRIVVVGGPTMVSDAVMRELEAFVDSPAEVSRIQGANRFETSRKIAQDAFPSGASVAFIATGRNFPDALAAGPAAASLGAPVILVDGAMPSIDAATIDVLGELGVQRVYILGGPNSVSTGVESSLNSAGYAGERITGANRYETATLINYRFFSDSEFVVLANGGGFADALGGGALAGRMGAPLYLSVQQCLLPYVGADILDLDAKGALVLGGTNMIGDAVMQGRVCS